MEWTKDQKRIIDLRNSNILVSAAAGSGKTAVLVERIINLVKNENKDIDEFLVVTFTNAAATAMKQKIQKALVDASHKGENLRHIRNQLSLLNKAHITTIHSFCMDIVKNNFHVVGLDPSFRIGDTNELNIIFQESIDEVLENNYKERSERFRILVEAFGENRGDTELCEIITRLYKFLLSFPDPFKWLKSSVNMVNMTPEEFKSSLWYKEILNYIQMQVDGAKGIVELGIKICNEPDGPGVYELTLNEDLVILDELFHGSNSLVSCIDGIQKFEAPTLKSIKKADILNIEKQKEVQKLRDEYKKIINSLKTLLPYKDMNKYMEDLNHMHDPMESLEDIIMELDKTYKDKKQLKSIVDFNDLEHYALKILREEAKDAPSDIGISYRNKLNYIFIDEYQDSNSLQETIIEQIKKDNNLFMVGDVKQSIYRFRLADPSIFNYKYKNYERDHEDLKEEVIDRVVELNKNFRSREEILDATNSIFSKIMTANLGEVDYNENVFLRCGNDEFTDINHVELNIIDKISDIDSDNSDNVNDELESMETAELEAIFAVKKIKDLLNEKTFDADSDNKLRKIEYKDIVILSRSVSKTSTVFEDVFSREGIPFYFEGGTGYFDTIEIQVMVNLLKLVDNTRQDIPLISVMRSPIGNFTTKELIKIRLKYKKGSYIEACGKYIEKIEENVSEEEFSDALIKKLQEFFQIIQDWTNRSHYTPLNDLIWEILMETKYYHFVGALPNGKVRQANLRLLSDKAYEFEKTSMKGLFKFLVYIEKLNLSDQDGSSTAKTLGENDNVVRLMTIHKSKGLEFPVVLLCGLSKKFNVQDTMSKVLMHKEYGIAPKYINIEQRVERDTIGRIAISKKIKFENLSEEMRILYVAMTRAIDRLIMIGSINKMDTSFKKWRKGYSQYSLYKGNSYMDWIGSCLFKDMDSDKINEALEKGKWEKWNVRRISIGDLSGYINACKDINIIEKIDKLAENIDPEKYREIERRLGYKYSYESSINVPAKLSVTAIKDLNREKFEKLRYKNLEMSQILEFDQDNKNFILDKKEFKGSEIGTLIHLVMDHIDIRKQLDRNGLKEQLDELLDKNQLTESEVRFISRYYLDKIEAFFKSDIGLRMVKSSEVKKETPFIIKKKANEILEGLSESDFVLVQGIIDCYFEEDGEIVIIDYKTDNVKKDEIEEIKAEYKDQIDSYKDAIERITKKRVKESYLYLFSLGIMVDVD